MLKINHKNKSISLGFEKREKQTITLPFFPKKSQIALSLSNIHHNFEVHWKDIYQVRSLKLFHWVLGSLTICVLMQLINSFFIDF